MKLFKSGGAAEGTESEEDAAALAAEEQELRAQERLVELKSKRGDQFCSARSCKEETGLPCAYIDRRNRRCPTAWCTEHRAVTHDDIYCPTHGRLLDGTDNGFGFTANPDVGNRVPSLVNWVTRELDADVDAVIHHVAAALGEDVVVEPIRFVLFGVDRTRTWERSWKVVSHFGISLRIAIAVEENQPDLVLGKVNSKITVRLSPPWNEEYPVGEEPPNADAGEAALRDFRHDLFMGLARPSNEWLDAQRDAIAAAGDSSGETRQGTY